MLEGWSDPLYTNDSGIEYRAREETGNIFMMKRKEDKYKVKFFCVADSWNDHAISFGPKAKRIKTKRKRKGKRID